MKNKSDTYCRHWTQTARDCYERGCDCRGCLIKEQMENPCRMKAAVFELVRKFGAPPPVYGLTRREQQIIDAILSGANTKREIAEKVGIHETNIQTVLNRMYCLAESEGYTYQKKYKLPEFIEWVRQGGME